MKCKVCSKEFPARTVIQKYCSRRCRDKATRMHIAVYDAIDFECAECGRHVHIEKWKSGDPGRPDKRTRFCCQACERKYWKSYDRQHQRDASVNSNFRTAKEYAAYERYTNEHF